MIVLRRSTKHACYSISDSTCTNYTCRGSCCLASLLSHFIAGVAQSA